MKRKGLVDKTGIIPLANDGIHIFKAVPEIGDGKFIVGIRHAPQVIPTHHVNAKTVQQSRDDAVAHTVEKYQKKQDAEPAHRWVKPAGHLALAEKQSEQNKQEHCRNGAALHADQKKPAAGQQITPTLAFFLSGGMGRESGVIQNHLPEHKGQVVDLQLQRVTVCLTKGDQTGDERLDAGCKTVAGNAQQHDGRVGNADADGKQLNGLFAKQIDQRYGREDGNALEQKLRAAADHGGNRGKAFDPDDHRPEKQRRHQGHIQQGGLPYLPEARFVRVKQGVQHCQPDHTQRDGLGQTAQHTVEDFPLAQPGSGQKDHAADGQQFLPQRAVLIKQRGRSFPAVILFDQDLIQCTHEKGFSFCSGCSRR